MSRLDVDGARLVASLLPHLQVKICRVWGFEHLRCAAHPAATACRLVASLLRAPQVRLSC